VLGSGSCQPSVTRVRIQLWTIELELVRHLTASSHIHQSRPHIFLRLEDDGAFGWGEISPDFYPVLGDPGHAELIQHLTDVFIPMLNERGVWHQNWSSVGLLNSGLGVSRWSASLCEMALLSLELERESKSLAELWPPQSEVAVQHAQSLMDGIEPSQQPVRVKVTHESIVKFADQFCKLAGPVIIDYNAAGRTIKDVVSDVEIVSNFCELVAVEQPFAPGNLVDHALLVREINVDVSLDESVRSITDLRLIAAHNAAQRVCVKVARVGGPSQAISILRKSKVIGLNPYVGGFFESEIARSISRTLCHYVGTAPSDIGTVSFTESVTNAQKSGSTVGLNLENIDNKVLEAEWAV
jgi:L-alanine-DL-glutamate epimerase-like enolase superfamily enzyme